ncbi:phenylacetate--CoA ligase family protein [Propioniciclava sinopodophylli]|uniref:phenylacetate--CoA ligase family protein n=1 Tax=Propioniciclava sinopodophylli TaxID=1837344 RepID=UPI0024929ED3|nr:hypothetical protein [Propioniciclava sinopodophylli]
MSTDPALFARLLTTRALVRRHAAWSPERLRADQARRLVQLRAHARHRSPFYAEHHKALGDAPLAELPPVTKKDLMAQWDDLVTVPGLRLVEASARLAELEASRLDPGRPWQGRWWLAGTAGTTGRRGVFVWDRPEWAQVLTSYARVNDWAGVRVGVRHRMRAAIVSTTNPTHQSAVVGASLRNPLVETLRLDAARPIGDTIAALNAFQPRLLVCYASVLGPLAEAQLAGRLAISPEKVVTASEETLEPARLNALMAWRVGIVSTYAATETATIASSCPLGSMHLYEDFVIPEPVDDDYRPVPDGVLAPRVLVTVLFSRTLPLIRYELSDSVRLATERCPCGLPFRCLAEVCGRTDDTLRLAGRNGEAVPLHPAALHEALEPVAVHGWQVEQRPDGLTISVVDPEGRLDTEAIRSRVRSALSVAGVAPTVGVDVKVTREAGRTPLGKVRLIRPLAPD